MLIFPCSGSSTSLLSTSSILSPIDIGHLLSMIPNHNHIYFASLIYSHSRDGSDSSTFHKLCENQGPTLTVIKCAKGFIFGGFTMESFSGHDNRIRDPNVFIYTLKNPHNIPPTKYLPREDMLQYSIFSHSTYGPLFGSGNTNTDIGISGSNYFINFPNVFIDTTGKGFNTFTGSGKIGSFFPVSEVEVWKLSFSTSKILS